MEKATWLYYGDFNTREVNCNSWEFSQSEWFDCDGLKQLIEEKKIKEYREDDLLKVSPRLMNHPESVLKAQILRIPDSDIYYVCIFWSNWVKEFYDFLEIHRPCVRMIIRFKIILNTEQTEILAVDSSEANLL